LWQLLAANIFKLFVLDYNGQNEQFEPI